MSRWVEFDQVKDTGKTKSWTVNSKQDGYYLGMVSWHGPWRQYCFFATSPTVWNQECLRDVAEFIRQQMELRKR